MTVTTDYLAGLAAFTSAQAEGDPSAIIQRGRELTAYILAHLEPLGAEGLERSIEALEIIQRGVHPANLPRPHPNVGETTINNDVSIGTINWP